MSRQNRVDLTLRNGTILSASPDRIGFYLSTFDVVTIGKLPDSYLD